MFSLLRHRVPVMTMPGMVADARSSYDVLDLRFDDQSYAAQHRQAIGIQDRGVLAVGKAADLVVLERNLFETAPLAIHQVQVEMTVLGGKVVYERVKD